MTSETIRCRNRHPNDHTHGQPGPNKSQRKLPDAVGGHGWDPSDEEPRKFSDPCGVRDWWGGFGVFRFLFPASWRGSHHQVRA